MAQKLKHAESLSTSEQYLTHTAQLHQKYTDDVIWLVTFSFRLFMELVINKHYH